MPAASQGHIPPLHLSILNYSSCCLHMPPCTPTTPFPAKFLATPVHTSTPNRKKDVTWAISSCSGSRWNLLPGGNCGVCVLHTFTLSSYSSASGEKAPNLPVQTLSPYPRRHAISRAHTPRELNAGRMASVYNGSAASPHARLCFHLHSQG